MTDFACWTSTFTTIELSLNVTLGLALELEVPFYDIAKT